MCVTAGTDVIALLLTDLTLTKELLRVAKRGDEVRYLLKHTIHEADRGDYMYNEDDRSLLMQHIPAQVTTPIASGAYL